MKTNWQSCLELTDGLIEQVGHELEMNLSFRWTYQAEGKWRIPEPGFESNMWIAHGNVKALLKVWEQLMRETGQW